MSAATMYMTLLSQRSGVTVTVVSDPTVNVAPIIGATPDVTPAVWSSGASDTQRWEMADTDAGPWSTVDDMPAIDTPYTDQTFGKVLRWVEAQGGVTAESAATAAVAEVPVQTLGAELLTNPNFSNWTGDNPDGWTVLNESGSDPMVTQVAPNGSAGTGAARIVNTATSSFALRQAILTQNDWYVVETTVSAYTSGSVTLGQSGAGWLIISAAGVAKVFSRAVLANTIFQLSRNSGAVDMVLDGISVKKVTLNTQLTAPTADMQLEYLDYTLPVSPVLGDGIDVLARISNFATGDYWRATLSHTGSQWNFTLTSVAANTPTTRITATNVGATDGIRVRANGDTWEIFTRSGGVWTSRGTFSSSLYNTATGVNARHLPSVTPGVLHYTDPT